MSKEVKREAVQECDTRDILKLIYEQNKKNLDLFVRDMEKEIMGNEKSY